MPGRHAVAWVHRRGRRSGRRSAVAPDRPPGPAVALSLMTSRGDHGGGSTGAGLRRAERGLAVLRPRRGAVKPAQGERPGRQPPVASRRMAPNRVTVEPSAFLWLVWCLRANSFVCRIDRQGARRRCERTCMTCAGTGADRGWALRFADFAEGRAWVAAACAAEAGVKEWRRRCSGMCRGCGAVAAVAEAPHADAQVSSVLAPLNTVLR